MLPLIPSCAAVIQNGSLTGSMTTVLTAVALVSQPGHTSLCSSQITKLDSHGLALFENNMLCLLYCPLVFLMDLEMLLRSCLAGVCI